ncbi:MAG: hypothetical protein GY942_09055 [Aestuariibacter sp.]|nr:hypothetical protein [Aestuariibacter sp.]
MTIPVDMNLALDPGLYIPGQKPRVPVEIDPDIFPKTVYANLFNSTTDINGYPGSLQSAGTFEHGNLVTDGTGKGFDFGTTSTDKLWPEYGPFTYFARAKMLSTPGAATEWVLFINSPNVSAANYISVYVRSNGTAFAVRGYVSGTYITVESSAYVHDAGTYYNFMLTREGAGNCYLYVDGSADTPVVDADRIYSRHGTHLHTLAAESDGDDPGEFEIEAFVITHEYTPPAIARMLANDPYQFARVLG